jgi:hypothetical protein
MNAMMPLRPNFTAARDPTTGSRIELRRDVLYYLIEQAQERTR